MVKTDKEDETGPVIVMLDYEKNSIADAGQIRIPSAAPCDFIMQLLSLLLPVVKVF
jgi:hypothetical protein